MPRLVLIYGGRASSASGFCTVFGGDNSAGMASDNLSVTIELGILGKLQNFTGVWWL